MTGDYEVVEVRARKPRILGTAVSSVVVLVFILLGLFWAVNAQNDLEWVHGKYGEKCYIKGTEHKNIKYPVYFDSYEECELDLLKP